MKTKISLTGILPSRKAQHSQVNKKSRGFTLPQILAGVIFVGGLVFGGMAIVHSNTSQDQAKAPQVSVATGFGTLQAPIAAPNAGSYATVQSDEHVVLVAKNSPTLKTVPGRLVPQTVAAYQYAVAQSARASTAPASWTTVNNAMAQPQHQIVAGGLSTALTGLVAYDSHPALGQVASP